MDNVYGINLIPDDDLERVAALDRYQIFNSHHEKAFDSICEMACELFSCPISHISFLNTDTEFIKAGIGIGDITHVSRGIGFCSVAILKPELLLVEDTLQNELFAGHPYVQGELKIRFYAAAPVITPDGHVIGTLCIIDTKPRNMTEKEQLLLMRMSNVVMEQTELRLNNLNLLHQKDDFINIAAHEMRTPLTTLKAAMQVLNSKLSGMEDQGAVRLLEQANKGVGKLTNLVNDMFDAGRLKERNLSFERSIFRIGELMDNCRDYVGTLGNFSLVVAGDEDLEVTGDLTKLEQVLINLIDNAVKYAPNSKKITINLQTAGEFLKISVADRGPGIPQDTLPHLFRRYFRSDPKSMQTGLGLGLYIAAEIVKHHGGDIGVESNPDEGSTFWFTLPLAIRQA